MKTSNYTKIGIVMLISILALIWGIQFLQGKNVFKSENYFYVIYKRVDGLQVSSPVMINGFKVGQVRDISLHENKNNLLVKFAVNKNFEIPKKTTAKIYSSDIMGTKAIQLLLSKENENHEFGDTILGNIEMDLKEEVNMQMLPFKRKAESLMGSMDSVLIVIRSVFNEETRKNLVSSFSSIKRTVNNLEKTTLALDTIIQNQQFKLTRILSNVESISLNLKNNNEKISKVLTNFLVISDTIKQIKLNTVILNAKKTLATANHILERINKGEGTIGLLLNNETLYRNLEQSSKDLNILLKDVKENPKKYVHYSLFDNGKVINLKADSPEAKEILEKEKEK